jgi:protein NrfD
MPTEIAYDLPYTQWNWRIGVYIALIGIAGGAYLTGYLADVLSTRRESREHGRVAKYGYLTGLLGLAIGPPVLLSHLATPFRAMMIPLTMTNLDSWMAIGSYMILGFGLGALLMFVWTAFGQNRPNARATAVADGGTEDVAADGGPAKAATGGDTASGLRGIANRTGLLGPIDALADATRPSSRTRLAIGGIFGVFAAGVLLYSAMAFGSGSTERVALWDKTFLIPVQILGGLGAGLTVAVGMAAIESRQSNRTLENYSLAASGLLVASVATVLATVVLLPGQVPAAEPAIDNMLGTHAMLFVGGAVIAGLVVPIALSLVAVLGRRNGLLSPTAATASYAVAGLLVVVGKIALALTYLVAAEFTPMPLPI